MSLPPKTEPSASSISQVGSTSAAAASSNPTNSTSSVNGTSNDINNVSNGGQSTSGQSGQPQTTAQSGLDDQYRYSQNQHQSQSLPQHYPYYSYQPAYSQQFQHSYPYYKGNTSNPNGNTQTTQLGAAYPNYNDYSRINYAQNYGGAPAYQNQLLPNGSSVSNGGQGTPTNGSNTTPTNGSIPLNISNSSQALPNPVSGLPQANTQQITTTSTSAIGQVQPLGSRPRVTTTMWEDEKTLCYQVDANGVSVVRRADNNMINGTKLLNVAHMTRGRRDGILKSEKVRDVVKIGSMHLKGVWIPFERALAMAQREGIVDLLYPLFVRDIKQVIQQGSTTQPNPTATVGPVATGPNSGITGVVPQWASYQQQQQMQQSISGPQSSSAQQAAQQSQYQPQGLQSSQTADTKPNLTPQQQPYSQQPIQQGYYNSNVSSYPYYPQYQYGSYSNSGNTVSNTAAGGTSGATSNNGSGGPSSTTTGATSVGQNQYQYPQYNYGYAPQYQNSQYDEKDTK